MKVQWTWLFGLLFAVLIAVFSVANVDSVPVNYIFGTSQWPLVLVILIAALLGALVSGLFATFRSFTMKRRINELRKEITEKELLIARLENEANGTLPDVKHVPVTKRTEDIPVK